MEQLVLLPGFLCDSAVWRHQLTGLSDLAQITVADYGPSDSLGAMAERVLAATTGPFAVAGHSMGGRVVLEIYRRAPDRVRGLGLFNTGCKPKPVGETGDREAAGRYALLEIAKTAGMRAMGLTWLPPMVHPDRMSDTVLVEEILAMFGRKTPAIQAAQINALLGRPDAVEVVQSIHCPSLLLSGAQDGFSGPDVHAEMAAWIPGSQLAIIENSGHMAPMEQPADVTAAMRRWLNEITQ